MSLKAIEKRMRKYRKSTERNYLPRWIKRTLTGAIVVGLLIIVFGAAFIVYYLNEPRGVDLAVSAPSDVARGVPFELDVNITNISGAPMQNGLLTVTLPEGLLLWSSKINGNIYSESIGSVGTGSLTKKVYKIIAVGGLNSRQDLAVSFSYLNQNGTRFEVKSGAAVLVSSEVVSASVVKPDQILNGSSFSFTVNYVNNSDFDFPNLVLEADFPDSYTFDSASEPPSSLSNVWQLGSSLARSTGTIAIKGKFSNSSASSFDIPLKFFTVLNGKNYQVADYDASFSLSPSPIGISIFTNGMDHYVAKPVDTLNYVIQYNNMSGIALTNVTVKAALSGFGNWSSVKTDGSFDPNVRTITWTSATTPPLQFISPGGTGRLNFSLNVSSAIPTSLQGLSTKNLYVRVVASVSSPSVPYYVSGNSTFAETSVETKISSLVYLNARALLQDPGSGIVNARSFPPKAGVPTTYTLHWLLSNYGNDLSEVKISAPLPPGVTFTDIAKSNIASSTPAYDTSTQSMVWNVGDVVANSGLITGPIEGIFQVQATPDASDIGSYKTILGKTILSGNDNFTGTSVNASYEPLTTLLPTDLTVSPGEGVVTQR